MSVYVELLKDLQRRPSAAEAQRVQKKIGGAYRYCAQPRSNLSAADFSEDGVAREHLPKDAPSGVPVLAYGDGNCLFRSMSIFFRGDEGDHHELRLRTAIELILNASHYVTHCWERAEQTSRSTKFALGSCLSVFVSEDAAKTGKSVEVRCLLVERYRG